MKARAARERNATLKGRARRWPGVQELERIAARLERDLDEKDALREQAIPLCRRILRASTGAVRGLHQGHDPGRDIEQAVRDAAELEALLRGHADVAASGFVEEALQELAEAAVVHAILRQGQLPTPAELHCGPLAYALGLGDAVGEVRRACLDAMRQGRDADAERLLAWMDALFEAVMRFDQPVAGHVRRKQDVARSLVEKTRGELTVMQRGRTLEQSIAGLLDELEQGKGKRKAKPAANLDLDAESDFPKKGKRT
jgi:translin